MDRSAEAEEYVPESREYFRVKTRIPVVHRTVESEEFERIRREIETPCLDLERIDVGLAAWLRRLEDKLDLILSQVDPALPRPLSALDALDVELSGSGMRFSAPELPEVGRDILVELELPGELPRRVRALAHVVRRVPPRSDDDDWGVAVSFRVIYDVDRDAIVRFSHDLQRVALRARASGEDGE